MLGVCHCTLMRSRFSSHSSMLARNLQRIMTRFRKKILRMEIENIQKSMMLDIALCDWVLQISKFSWAEFTVFMYKSYKYRRDTAATNGSSGFSSNFHNITSEKVSGPPSLATTATSDISELASTLSAAADAQTAKITALTAAMINQ